MTRRFLIDTDGGADDAVAIMMALLHREIDVATITTVAGNVEVEQATKNTLLVAQMCGSSVPVYAGAKHPLLRQLKTAQAFHGPDGLSNNYLPAARDASNNKHAADAIIETVEKYPGLVLVTLGPLTNIALALSKSPSMSSKVARCVVMGGAPCAAGNITPAAEYNIWVDPEAAEVVFQSTLPIELVGWQLSRGDAALTETEIKRLSDTDSPYAQSAIKFNSSARLAYLRESGLPGIPLPDAIAMALAIEPSIGITSSKHHVKIETSSELTRGMTVVDLYDRAATEENRSEWLDVIAAPKRQIYWKIEVGRWKEILLDILKGNSVSGHRGKNYK